MMQYVLKNGIILDGTENMKPVTGHMIRVENDKIAEILPENSPVSGCEVIDLKGAYVLPGLINLHVHLATSGKPPRANKKPTNYKRLFQILSRSRLVKFVLKRMLRGYARTELMSGVTTIRTVGGILDMDARIRDEINAGKIQGPRILAGNTGVMKVNIDDPLEDVDNIKIAVPYVEADGKRISYTYDKTGLLTGADYAGEGSIDNSYNELGLLTVTKGMEGTTSYQYNEDGKLLSVTTPDGDTVSYTYNEKGLKAGITYPDGSQVQYAYDSMGRLGSVTGLDGGITEYEYDAAGRRTKTVSENRTITYTYDEGNRLTGLNVAGDVQLSFGYTYDKNGSMTSETLSGDGMDTTSRYTYDLAGQLTGFSRTDGYEECYAYDPAGHMTERICKAQGGEEYALSMAYDQADRLVRMERAAKERKITGIVYRYDENGNLTSKTSDIGTDTYHYNAMDQLTSYEGYDGYQAKYAYQDTGVLLRKETKGNQSRLTQEEVLEGKSVSGEIDIEEGAAGIGAADMGSQIDAGDWIVTSYVYDINQEYEQVLSETTQGQTTCYEYGLERISAYGPDGKTDYLYDGRGSVAEQLTTGTDLAENVKKVIKSYTPYGEQLNEKLFGFGYNGEEYDSATGMVYLRARWYEPAMARFAQKDIERGELTDTISQNRYLYAANDPVNYTDPSGEFKLPIINPLKTIGNGIRNKLPDPLKSVYDYGAKFVSTLTAPVKQLADTVVATGELISSVYHKNKMEAGNQQDYVVLNTIIETLGIWDKVNSGDMKNAPLQERLKYACGISDEEYQKARKYYQ